MDATHIHLALNHVPVVGLGIVSLALIAAMIARSSDLSKFALAMAVLMALLALPVFFTGEPAEERVEHMAGVSESIIEAHEESAELAFGAMMAIGAGALVLLAWSWRRPFVLARARPIMLGACLIVTALMGRAANFGGQIRHPEIRADIAAGKSDFAAQSHGPVLKADSRDDSRDRD